MTIDDIKQALYEWATRVTSGTVIWLYGDGPKPDKPYVTLNLIGPQKPGFLDDVNGTDTSDLSFVQSGQRTFTVSVNVYSDSDALTWAYQLQASLDNPVEIDIFNKADIGLGDTGDVNDLSELLETKWERRAQFDFTIFSASNIEFENDIIETAETENNL